MNIASISFSCSRHSESSEITKQMNFHATSKDEFVASLDSIAAEIAILKAEISGEPAKAELAEEPVKARPLSRWILYRMHCNQCGNTYMKSAKEGEDEAECACGAAINLRDAGDFHFVCGNCGETCDGRSVTSEPEYTHICKKCRTRATLRWSKKNRRYENCTGGK